MPEEIRNNWLNNIFNENFDIPAHSIVNEWIIRGVNSLNISEQERNDCYNYYYSNRDDIISSVLEKYERNNNWQALSIEYVKERVRMWLPPIWSHNWNYLFLWKAPWKETLRYANLWNLYFLKKWNIFWRAMAYVYNNDQCPWIIDEMIKRIDNNNALLLSTLQYNFLENHKICLWDRVHIFYSNSASDKDRIALLYSWIWEILIQRLITPQNDTINIILLWKDLPENQTIFSVDFIDWYKEGNRWYFWLKNEFREKLRTAFRIIYWIDIIINNIRISAGEFKNYGFNFELNVTFNGNEYNKKVFVFLWSDTSWWSRYVSNDIADFVNGQNNAFRRGRFMTAE
jgi:hypothetical protein